MDDIDRQILAQVIEDGRMSLADIGARVGLSSSAVKRRLERLERDRAIKGYTAVVDPAAIGWDAEAFIEITCEGSRSLPDLRAALVPHPEVVGAYTISGEADAILHVRARDMNHLEQVIERLHQGPLIARTKTSIVLTRLVERQPRRAEGTARSDQPRSQELRKRSRRAL